MKLIMVKLSVLLLLLPTIAIETDPPHIDDDQDTEFKINSTATEEVNPSDARGSESNPNIIFIMTDQQNFRTLGCYRDYLLSKHSKEEVNVWGNANTLDTPNLDALAKEGALFANFYTTSPICTTSRASFMSGLYPRHTEAYFNHGPMSESIKTWAQVLQEKKGYYTSYIGKWHLDGEGKPDWYSGKSRPFGFNETKYRFNRGHWKYFEDDGDEVQAYTVESEYKFTGNTSDHYATDFLFDKGMDFITTAAQTNKSFAVMMSIPDPHGPDENRPLYRQMYDNLTFNMPHTAFKAVQYNPASPKWSKWKWDMDLKDFSYYDATLYLYKARNSATFQRHLRQYFGMVKCIDDNIGKLLSHLKKSGINNTMIVFTSDHGDMLYEHSEMTKGSPYQASAGVPFIVHYPGVVGPNKIIETAYSSIDTFPTLLSLAGIDLKEVNVPFQGVDASPELLSSVDIERNETKTILMHFTYLWAAASTNQYKLVVSHDSDRTYLFDLERDPSEIHNYIDSRDHKFVKKKLQVALADGMNKYDIAIDKGKAILFDSPVCIDNRDTFEIWNGKKKLRCTQGSKFCQRSPRFSRNCPVTCNKCRCKDSPGLIYVKNKLTTCGKHLRSQCSKDEIVRLFCPKLCNVKQYCP